MKTYVNSNKEEFVGYLTGEVTVIENGAEVEKAVKIYNVSDEDKRKAGYIPLDEYINKEIDNNKKLLADSDYKVLKCYEASVKNVELPYDLDAVIELRDGYRAEINSLEEELREYLATV